MTTIADYRGDIADLLHDPNFQYWSTTQIDRYANKARTQLVRDTACLRTLQTLYLSQAVEAYTFGSVTGAAILTGGSGYLSGDTAIFSGGGGTGVAATLGVTSGAVTSITFTNFGSGYTSAPTISVGTGTGTGATFAAGAISVNTFDVLGINVIWGNMRYPLQWRPWSQFSNIVRPWVGQQDRPAMWAVYGETQIYVGRLPDQTYQAELDSVVLPIDIATITVDPIPAIMQAPIPFFAAYLAKFNDQRLGEAATFQKQYEQKMQEATQAYTRRIPSG